MSVSGCKVSSGHLSQLQKKKRKEFELDDSSGDGDYDDEIITEGEMNHSEYEESEDEET